MKKPTINEIVLDTYRRTGDPKRCLEAVLAARPDARTTMNSVHTIISKARPKGQPKGPKINDIVLDTYYKTGDPKRCLEAVLAAWPNAKTTLNTVYSIISKARPKEERHNKVGARPGRLAPRKRRPDGLSMGSELGEYITELLLTQEPLTNLQIVALVKHRYLGVSTREYHVGMIRGWVRKTRDPDIYTDYRARAAQARLKRQGEDPTPTYSRTMVARKPSRAAGSAKAR